MVGLEFISNEVSLYSQHIKGTKNIIAESLSKDFNISYQPLPKLFDSILPSQTAEPFHIKLLPRDIFSSSTQPMEPTKLLQPSSLVTDKNGAYSLHTHVSQTNSWTGSHKVKRKSWCHHLQHQCKENSLVQHSNPNSSTEPSNPLYWMYICPS